MKKILNGKYVYRGYEYNGYEICCHGYYAPDRTVWWEAVNVETGCADFHEHTKRDLKKLIDKKLNLK